jgi:hypothetical protein
VLEHVPDDLQAMRELRRVLRQTGSALIQVPISASPSTDEDPSLTEPEDRARSGRIPCSEDHLPGRRDSSRRAAHGPQGRVSLSLRRCGRSPFLRLVLGAGGGIPIKRSPPGLAGGRPPRGPGRGPWGCSRHLPSPADGR